MSEYQEEIAVGDVVVLKSGSPRMVVEGIACGQVTCVWWVDEGPGRGTFLLKTLKKAPEYNAFEGEEQSGMEDQED